MPEEGAEIMNLTPDFSEAMDFSPFPDATYLCKVVDISAFQSKPSSPNPGGIKMIEWTFMIEDDKEYTSVTDGSKQNVRGRQMFRNTPAEGKGAGFLRSMLQALKYDETKFRLPDSKLELVGRKLYITTKLDNGTSPPRNKPDSWKPAAN